MNASSLQNKFDILHIHTTLARYIYTPLLTYNDIQGDSGPGKCDPSKPDVSEGC